MFRFIIDIQEINIDNVKLPPVPGLGMIKRMPNEQKFSMLVSTINSQKAMFIPKLQEEAQKKWGYIDIADIQADMPMDGSCYLRFRIDINQMDYDKAIDSLLPSIFQLSDIEAVFGNTYHGAISVPDVINFMHQAPTNSQKEFYFVKSLSSQKEQLIRNIELGASMQGAVLRVSALRFLMKQ